MAAAAVSILASQSPAVQKSELPASRVSPILMPTTSIPCDSFFFIKQPNSRAGRMWHLATHGFEAAQVASKNELAKNRIGQRRHDWRFDCPAAYAEIHIEKRSLVLMSH